MALLPRGAKAETKFFPLPMYTTNPNEGSTYGFMPVFLGVGDNGRIANITAPSLSYNSSAGFTATARYYRFLEELRAWRVIASISTRVNRTLWFQYDDDRRTPGLITQNVFVRVRRNLFYRFFGLGPDSLEQAESSYTRVTAIVLGRVGRNFSRDFNIGAWFEARADRPEEHTIKNLPATQVEFPTAPGLDGAALIRQGLSLRYDTREGGDYALDGFASELTASIAEGVDNVNVFGEFIWNTRMVRQETSWLGLAARAYWRQLVGGGGGNVIPFYYQASLGGELLLRGFPEDRFIDTGAWEIEVEQRIRVLNTSLFGVSTDWRIDPFVAAGQVYGVEGIFSHPRASVGIGLRAWIKPDVLGRVDLAYGGEGIRAYIVLGYPY